MEWEWLDWDKSVYLSLWWFVREFFLLVILMIYSDEYCVCCLRFFEMWVLGRCWYFLWYGVGWCVSYFWCWLRDWRVYVLRISLICDWEI